VIGTRLGHYLIKEQIGAGGMGVVYRARDERLARDVAVKVLPSGSLSDEVARKRLRKEALALSRLNHPNIETVYDFDTQEEADFLVAELIPGITLNHKLASGPLPEREVVRLGSQLAEGLEAAHQAGLLHRDLKPGNLRITPDGRLKILDFGLATDFGPLAEFRTTMGEPPTAGIAGTLPYLTPEQLAGRGADARSDVHSAGAVLYEMATGRPAFEEKSGPLLIEAILNRYPAAPSALNPRISPALEAVILKALDKDPGRRYQSARELSVDLQRLSSPTTASPSPVVRSRKPWVLLAVAAVLMMAIVVGYGSHFWRTRPPSSDRIALAVLPFDVLTGEEDIGFLRVGIADAIITKLSNVGRLRLRPTSAVLSYERQHADLRQAGQRLAVEYVATGTLQKTGERFRIGTQLVRISDGASIWGEHYDVSRSDLLSLEDAIAEKISVALQINISSVERDRLYRRYTDNLAAYELYLKGRTEMARFTPQSTLAAIAAFESALRLDSEYALAHAGLGMASAVMRIRFSPEADLKKWEDRARREAQRALVLDSNLAEAHEALAAMYRNTEFDWERTVAESHRALELNPSLEMPHYYLAAAFYHVGLLEAVKTEVRAGLDINPVNRAEALRVQGASALFSGHFQEAERFLTELRQISGSPVSDWYLGQSLYYLGQISQAEAMFTALHGGAQVELRAQATLAALLAAQHDNQRARALLQNVTAATQVDHHAAYSIGTAYAQLGEFVEARRWLSRAASTGFPCYPWFEQDPLLKPLRGDAEFRRFLDGLRQSWGSAKARYASSWSTP
jgi:eukaryotic-like serine/threonine-protein kinase